MLKIFKKRKTKDTAHPFYALLIILFIAFIAANIIPSGVYERVQLNGRTVVDPNSFHFVDKLHVNFVDLFQSFYYGFQAISGLAVLIFFVGGAFGVANHIGLLETVLKVVYKKIKHIKFPVFVYILMVVFGTIVSFTGFYDLISIIFIPIIAPLTLALGYDVMTAAGIIMVGACIGYGSAMANPFFTAIAHGIAELPLFSALWFRGIAFLVFLIPATIYIVRYANKVKNNPEKSLLYGLDLPYTPLNQDEEAKLTPALKRAAIVFFGFFAFLIYGSVKLSFGYADMTATFAAMGLLTGLVYGMSLNEVCKALGKGMVMLLIPTIVMIYARSVLYVLEQASTIDTIIMFLAQFLSGGSRFISSGMMYVVQTLINFVIPSGSGQAMITMPMLIPLSDMIDIPRQVACLASQFGDGFSNFMWPTCGSLVAILASAKIPYSKWAKFFLPLFLIISGLSIITTWIALYIGLGPF